MFVVLCVVGWGFDPPKALGNLPITLLHFIVVKLQNTNAYAEPCRIIYTVTGKAAFYCFEV